MTQHFPLDELTLLYRCATQIHVTSDLEASLSLFVQWLVSKTGAATTFLHVWDDEVGELLPLRIETHDQPSPYLRRWLRVLVQRVVQAHEPLLFTDCTDLMPMGEPPEGVQSVLLLPLYGEQQLLGSLGFLNASSPLLSQQIASFQLVASTLCSTIRQHRWAQDLARRYEQLAQANERLDVTLRELERRQAMVESLEVEFAGDAIITIDPLGKIISWNKGAERIYGYGKMDVLGQPISLLYTPAFYQQEQQLVAHTLTGAVTSGVEMTRRTKTGRDIIVSLTVSAITDHLGQVIGVCAIERDISQRKQLEETIRRHNELLEQTVQERTAELQEAKERAEAANQAKSEFLANMSHELRTPLHGILGFARLGVQKVSTASAETLGTFFDKIVYSSEILLTLLNDLLDLAKLEAGKMQFAFAPADLNIFLASVIDEFYSLTAERHLTIQAFIPHEPTMVNLDPEKIMQVYRNLLSNAVKFAPEDSTITVNLHLEAETVLVSVRDQGPGIPPEETETIFDKFVQSSKTKTGAGGTGLGLSICREIVTAHQGRIWSANSPDGGAIFYVELPMCQAQRLRESIMQ